MAWLVWAIALFLVFAFVIWWKPLALVQLAVHCYPSVTFFFVRPRSEASPSKFALTIDDAPSPSTARILDVLRDHGAKATFFVIGGNARRFPDMIKRMVDEGHEIGNHGLHKGVACRLTEAQLADELQEVQATVQALAPGALSDASIKWYRPACGWISQAILKATKELGYRVALGSVFPHDPHVRVWWNTWLGVIWRVRPGSIVILHDRAWTPKALDRIFLSLGSTTSRYQACTLTQLMHEYACE